MSKYHFNLEFVQVKTINARKIGRVEPTLNSSQLGAIHLILLSVLNDRLNHAFHTNSCEAHHSLIARLCLQDTPQSNSYNYKTALAAISCITNVCYECIYVDY